MKLNSCVPAELIHSTGQNTHCLWPHLLILQRNGQQHVLLAYCVGLGSSSLGEPVQFPLPPKGIFRAHVCRQGNLDSPPPNLTKRSQELNSVSWESQTGDPWAWRTWSCMCTARPYRTGPLQHLPGAAGDWRQLQTGSALPALNRCPLLNSSTTW